VSQCALYVLGSIRTIAGAARPPGQRCHSLVRDQICWPDVVVGWGETSALAWPARLLPCALVVPDGRWDQPLSEDERAELDPENPRWPSRMACCGVGAIEADVVILPCPGRGSLPPCAELPAVLGPAGHFDAFRMRRAAARSGHGSALPATFR